MSSMTHGVSLILIVALLSQTAGCYTTRIQQTRGEEIKEEELQKGIWINMTLRPESDLFKSGKIAREFKCVINRVDQNNRVVVVTTSNKVYAFPTSRFGYTVRIKTSDIQKMEIIHMTKGEKVFSEAKTTFLIGGMAAIILLIYIAKSGDFGVGFGEF